LTNPEKGTDRWAVEHGEVFLTPLRLDMTDESAILAIHPVAEVADEDRVR
jgi:broad specificity polyphosphatase/5'/3'-nucleotidase SurE